MNSKLFGLGLQDRTQGWKATPPLLNLPHAEDFYRAWKGPKVRSVLRELVLA